MGRQSKLLLSQKTCQGHLFIAKLSGERQAGYYNLYPFLAFAETAFDEFIFYYTPAYKTICLSGNQHTK
jgi:hypothetical protein